MHVIEILVVLLASALGAAFLMFLLPASDGWWDLGRFIAITFTLSVLGLFLFALSN